jgi:signal transduction histidine kinase
MRSRKVVEQMKHPLASMAHDIKAPLISIIDLLALIEKGYVDDAGKSKELVGRAYAKAESLLKMVDDILDYTLLSHKAEINRERLDLRELLDESISTMKHFADERGLTINLTDPEKLDYSVFGNRTFLIRAFNNILMNGIKYNKPGGRIEVSIRSLLLRTKAGVSFEDTGIGIDHEDLKKVFNIFERGKYARRNIDGSIGLGLALVKQIVADHAGAIRLWSRPGLGTKVTIVLPLNNTGGEFA